MSIPLKTACCATTVALAMVPGIADAAELSQSDKIKAPAGGPATTRASGPAATSGQATASSQTGVTAATGKAASAIASSQVAVVQAGGQVAVAYANGQATVTKANRKAAMALSAGRRQGGTRNANIKLLVLLQQAVRKQRARMEAQWQRRADRAIGFALAQRGRPYVYGDTGRRGFDCSGLTQQAWRRAGISVPRVAAAQYKKIRNRVSRKNLRPGDLVFFHGLGHVGLYLGRSRFIHAPRTGRDVSVERLSGYYRKSFVGAVRPVWKPLPAIPVSLY